MGVTDGGFAGLWFSGSPDAFDGGWTMANNWEDVWPMLREDQRDTVLRAYCAAEDAFKVFGKSEVQS